MRTLIGILLLTIGCAANAQALKKLTLFGQPSVNNDAIWMAIEYGYFKEQGLDVDYRVFPSGTTAFQTFRTGQGDIVMTGDLPSVQYFFNNPGQYQTFAAIERDAKGYVAIARKDVRTAKDLAGKTIATRVGSTGSWFISEYLTKNGVDPKSVTVKNLDTQLLPAALCKGDIAAFFIWQPIGSRPLPARARARSRSPRTPPTSYRMPPATSRATWWRARGRSSSIQRTAPTRSSGSCAP